MAGYVYPYDVEAVFSMLERLLNLDKQQRELVDAALGALVERDRDLETYLGRSFNGESGTTTITAATGGATISFSKAFTVVPDVLISLGTGGGYTINHTAVTTTSFKVQVFDAVGIEQNAGNFSIHWLATT